MEDTVLDEIQFHQETVGREANSPLHLIREKEIEISGRVLAAKREAEEMVSRARKAAVEAVTAAEAEGARQAAAHEVEVRAEAEQAISDIKAKAEADAESLAGAVATRTDSAVVFVVDYVTGV